VPRDRPSRPRLLQQVFHEDAVIDNGRFRGGVAAYAPEAFQRHEAIPRAVHMIGNVLIDFIDDARAFIETYCQALEFRPGTGGSPDLDRVVRLRYADAFEERAGQWRIASRLVVIDHEHWQPSPASDTATAGCRLTGVRGEHDPVVQLRRSLGLR
jgi:hypothetical protein